MKTPRNRPPRIRRGAALLAAAALLSPVPLAAADLVRGVRMKLSAADLASGEAAVEEYRREHGTDREALDALGWLARGAVMLGRPERAAAYAAEVRRGIPAETPDLVVPLGAAIEVESKLKLAAEGRGAALRFLETELGRARDTALRSRIRKNIDLLSLEGEIAPSLGGADPAGVPAPRLAELAGRPVLLFFWASGCGDCKAEAAKLGRLREKYGAKGLAVIAPTRLYGTAEGDRPAPPAEETAHVARVFAESFPGLAGVPVPVDTETMVRWGVSATPTYALVDAAGTVRLYAPTRLSEAELSRRIEELIPTSASRSRP